MKTIKVPEHELIKVRNAIGFITMGELQSACDDTVVRLHNAHEILRKILEPKVTVVDNLSKLLEGHDAKE